MSLSQNSKFLAHFALVAVTLFYSVNFIISQDVMRGDFIPPLALVFFRVIGAGILFWIVHLVFIKEKIRKEDISYLLLCSLIGIVIAQNTFLYGLERTPTINASLIISTTPLMVTLFAIFILKEKFTKNKAIGLILAAIGAFVLISYKSKFQLGDDYTLGNLFMFLNALSYGLYLVLIKPMLNKYHPLTVIKWVFTFASPVILIISYQELRAIEWSEFTPFAWSGLVYVVVFATFFTYSLNAYAIKILSPVIAGMYLYFQPFLTSILSVMLGKDTLNTAKIVAGVLILSGLFIATNRSKKESIQMKK